MMAHMDLVIELLVFCTFSIITWVLGREVMRAIDQRRRLGEQGYTISQTARPLLAGRSSQNSFIKWVESSSSISEPAQRQKLNTELSLAGFDGPAAPALYVTTRFLLAIGLPLLY